MSLGDIERLSTLLKLHNFRGVFMRQLLPIDEGPAVYECGIINLGDIHSSGTHWTCYIKDGDNKFYFDSFGNAKPPRELVKYLGAKGLVYNTIRIQEFDDPPICGHLCLEVLRRHTNRERWVDIERTLRRNKYAWKTWLSY